MPLLAPGTTAGPDVPIVPPEPTPAPPAPAREFFTWTPDGGDERILSNITQSGIMLGGTDEDTAVIGLDMPPQDEYDTELASGGELANGRRWGARSIALPIVIHADTLHELEQHRRSLMREFNPARDGVFQVRYPGGDSRHFRARYSSGLDTAGKGRSGYPYYDTFTVILKARDPFAYGDEQSITFSVGAGGAFYPLPFTISPSTTTGESTIEIDGEVEVWPEWVLRGPMSTATLRNRDTGKTLELSPGLSAGEKLTIRTDPRTPPLRRFTRETGISWWSQSAGDFPVFWSLQSGSNRVTVLANGTSSDSRVTLSYAPRYLSA